MRLFIRYVKYVMRLFISKDENIGIDGNIEGQKYGNIGGNIGEISISIKL